MFGFLPGPSFCCGKTAAIYRMHFCGLCNGLRRDYGLWARWLINRDSTLLAVLGSALSSQPQATRRTTCCNPFGTPHDLLDANPLVHYASAVTICGLTTKINDDSSDEKGPRRWLALAGRSAFEEASSKALGILHGLHFPVSSVQRSLHTQTDSEQSGTHLISAARSTGTAYGEIVTHIAHLTHGPGSPLTAPLREIGQQLDFLIYTKDAWDDWSTDQRRGRYNPLHSITDIEERRAILAPLLNQSLAALSRAFDSLPLIRHQSLLSQMLVAGAATRVNDILTPTNQLSYLTRLKSREPSAEKKKGDKDWCSGCDCCEGCCNFPCRGSKGPSHLCDCNPCDRDGCGCCGCDCDCGCG